MRFGHVFRNRKRLLWILVSVFAVWWLWTLFFANGGNGFMDRVVSVRSADDIAQAVLKYKDETGKLPDFDTKEWILEVKQYLTPFSQTLITKNGQIKDPRGNFYEFNIQKESLDIYSYPMLHARRIDFKTGAVSTVE